MKEHLSLVSLNKHPKLAVSKGLAPIVCYEPWFPRFLETVKQSINDGHPVLIRLHSAASYPVSSEERYVNDLESHAVLIVGYDDIKQAVALIDPWNKGWGGTQGGRWWMPYHILSIKNVDGSMGVAMCLTPLEVKKEICWDAVNNLSINLQVGFYVPRGTVMDLQSWKLTEVKIDCTLPDSWGGGRISHTVQGDWIVGDMVNVSLPIINSPEHEGEIQLAVNAKIEGKRPYDFADNLQIFDSLHIGLPQSRVMEPEKNFIGSARG